MELTPDERDLILMLRDLDRINPPWREDYNYCYSGDQLRRNVIPETVKAYKKKLLGDKAPPEKPQTESRPPKTPRKRKCEIVSLSEFATKREKDRQKD